MAIPGSDTTTNTNTTGGAAEGADNAPGAGAAGGTITPEGQQQGGAAAGARPSTADLAPEVLKVRLDQERDRGEKRAQERFFAQYGVSSQAELDAKLARLKELDEKETKRAAEEEERKRASMSSEEKLRAENEQLRAQVADLKNQLASANSKVASMRQGQVVRAQASDLIDPDMVDAAELKLAAHIKELRDRGESAKVAEFDKPAKVREYFRDLAARQPKFAKALPEGAGKPAPAAPPKRPITTGASPARALPPTRQVPQQQNGKTLRPGTANSMNDKEAAEHVRKKYPGIRVPGLT